MIETSVWDSEIVKNWDVSPPISNTTGSLKLIFCSFEVLSSTIKPQNMSAIGPLVMEISHIHIFAVITWITTCVCIMGVWFGFRDLLLTKNTIWYISITNAPMTLIFYSFIVLDSTSKLQNMSFKLPLVLEIGGDTSQIFTISLSQTEVLIISFSDFRLPTLLWTNKTRAPMIGLP